MKKLIAIAFAAVLAACSGPEESNYQAVAAEQADVAAPVTDQVGNVTTPSGLRFETLTAAAGPRPQIGDTVLVTYEGRLTDGTLFDSSAQPVQMVVGELIPGFNEGLLLMNKGGRYRLRIPAAIGYGEAGAGGVIPPNADLDFTVALVDVSRGAAAQPLPPPTS